MKVLWICNVPIPEAKEVMGDETQVRVSWLVGISKALRKKVDLYIGYTAYGRTEIAMGKGEDVTFVAIPRKKKAVNDCFLLICRRKIEFLFSTKTTALGFRPAPALPAQQQTAGHPTTMSVLSW